MSFSLNVAPGGYEAENAPIAREPSSMGIHDECVISLLSAAGQHGVPRVPFCRRREHDR